MFPDNQGAGGDTLCLCPSVGDSTSNKSIIHHRTVKAYIRYHLYGVTAGVESSSFVEPHDRSWEPERLRLQSLCHIAIIDGEIPSRA